MIHFSEVDQVLQQPFVKQNIPKSSFHLVPNTYWTVDFYILSIYLCIYVSIYLSIYIYIYILLATTLTREVFFEGGLPGILYEKYLSFSVVNYISSSKEEVSKFATLL